jgi:acetoin utilization deacetylase AcuC-like enzyme
LGSEKDLLITRGPQTRFARIAPLRRDRRSFAQMTCHVRDVAARVRTPVGAVLEGGYHGAALANTPRASSLMSPLG